ncbi:MAG: rhodanese-like domain-containing protein [Schleiferiaceae bacterium]|nr:rhodanese-like domain-containing protein [Schleiferiaceae bacterium]
MKTIELNTLLSKMNTNQNLKMVSASHEVNFYESHIPGSINITNTNVIANFLKPEDEVVLYCEDRFGLRSIWLYFKLEALGFKNIYRFEGGVEEWRSEHLPLSGWSHARQPQIITH